MKKTINILFLSEAHSGDGTVQTYTYPALLKAMQEDEETLQDDSIAIGQEGYEGNGTKPQKGGYGLYHEREEFQNLDKKTKKLVLSKHIANFESKHSSTNRDQHFTNKVINAIHGGKDTIIIVAGADHIAALEKSIPEKLGQEYVLNQKTIEPIIPDDTPQSGYQYDKHKPYNIPESESPIEGMVGNNVNDIKKNIITILKEFRENQKNANPSTEKKSNSFLKEKDILKFSQKTEGGDIIYPEYIKKKRKNKKNRIVPSKSKDSRKKISASAKEVQEQSPDKYKTTHNFVESGTHKILTKEHSTTQKTIDNKSRCSKRKALDGEEKEKYQSGINNGLSLSAARNGAKKQPQVKQKKQYKVAQEGVKHTVHASIDTLYASKFKFQKLNNGATLNTNLDMSETNFASGVNRDAQHRTNFLCCYNNTPDKESEIKLQ